MPIIDISVQNKIATSPEDAEIICGNSGYVINFTFDSEWDEYNVKTARFRYNGVPIDVPFTGTQCKVPIITKAYGVEVSVYTGMLQTTTPAIINCRKSGVCDDGLPPVPEENIYLQLLELINGSQSCNIKRVESLDTENILNLRDMETGIYILYGYFRPHAGSDTTMSFPYNSLVGIVTKTGGTHVQVLTPVNNVINFIDITDDSYERHDVYLCDNIINVSTEDGETFTTDADFSNIQYYYIRGRRAVFNVPYFNITNVEVQTMTENVMSASVVYRQEGNLYVTVLEFNSDGTINITNKQIA